MQILWKIKSVNNDQNTVVMEYTYDQSGTLFIQTIMISQIGDKTMEALANEFCPKNWFINIINNPNFLDQYIGVTGVLEI